MINLVIGLVVFFCALTLVFMVIAISIFIDAKREYDRLAKKDNRNFGFPKKKIDIDRKDKK